MRRRVIPVLYALLAAVFYAINTPFSKLLIERIPATFMAAYLYLGAGVGVGIMYLFHLRKESKDERLTRADLPYTLGMILLDIAAPIFLMFGIKLSSASSASLLGNFEIVATTLIALVFFKEKVGKRLWVAIALITLSSMILSYEDNGAFDISYGSVFVLLATVCWGLENNCTRSISEKSTHQIVVLKGIFSGIGSFSIALLTGEELPAPLDSFLAMCLGFVSYGLSIFVYIRAQRDLGAAKTSAYYAVAPFIGSFLSFLVVGEKLSLKYYVALFFMVAGTVFVIMDTLVKTHTHAHKHVLVHTHDGIRHTHQITHEHVHHHFGSEDVHSHTHKEEVLSCLHPHSV